MPLVGFHGHIVAENFESEKYGAYDDYYLESLGLILFDNMSKPCRDGVQVDVAIEGETAAE